MRHFICIAVALGISAVTLHAQDQPKFSAAQQEVLDAHKARIAAGEKRDYATYSRLVADDCIYSDDDGILDTNPKVHIPVSYTHLDVYKRQTK